VYLPQDGGPLADEPYHLGALLIGPVRPATWRDAAPPVADFFAAKGPLQSMLAALRVQWTVERELEPFLHPGRAAWIVIRGKPAGWVGEIHPQVAAHWELDATVAGFELNLDVAFAHADPTPSYQDVTTFPAVREDLAVVVADGVSADEVLAVIREAGAPLLSDAQVFDVYRDPERVGAGNVSLAVRLTYRAPDRTLTDDDVAAKRNQVAKALSEQLGGRVRDN
jgi:phenylalanyl-tRNA synthetase beta chain